MTIYKINFFFNTLKNTSAHQQLFTRIDRISEMQETFMKVIPLELAEFCSLGKFTNGKLTIIVGTGAIAAKLKQTLPSLISKFHKLGFMEVTSIQITVQADYYTCHAANFSYEKPEISQIGTESLHKFANNLSTSPLKKAITSILENQTNKKT
ncbi:MAG: hypothetical protein CMH70_08035 [Nitrosomonadaceae bacterium]|nr:hypothetical protein [Nitrosomonadaceae bacterium]|tara:strand:- start:183 stop:641 length:459 start_codon:yes stop_codon:yes gene_type:complete